MTLGLYVSFCTATLMGFVGPGVKGSEVCWPATAILPLLAIPDQIDHNNDLSASQVKALHRHAQAITVIVFVDDDWSSGILVQRQGQRYSVITNRHVVDFGKRFQVVMMDGRRYAAQRQDHVGFKEDDLALLHFQSPEVSYPIATFAPALSLVPGTPVFASGFPVELPELKGEQRPPQPLFHLTSGQVSLVSQKVLAGGYQVGYTNPIEKGMSGGPVLNSQGQVIAINGMHAYPLWGDPYIFTDGSRPHPDIQGLMKRSSWAIPVERFLKLAPASLQRRL